MPKKALIYAWAVIITGVIVLVCAAIGWQSSDPPAFLTCLGLTAFAATRKMKFPKLNSAISPAFVFFLIAVATRNWSESVAIAAVLGLVQCLWRPLHAPTPLQVAFNGANLAIAGGVAHGVAHLLIDAAGADSMILMLGTAGVALLTTNTLITATILGLVREAPFMVVWRSLQLWSVPYYLAGGVLATIWVRADLSGHGIVVIAAVSVYLLSVCWSAASRRLAVLPE